MLGEIIKVETTVDVDLDDLWETLWCTEGHGSVYWCDAVRDTDGSDFKMWTLTGDNYLPNPHDFKVLADDKWHEVTLSALAYAWVNMKQDGVTHCGGYSVDEVDDCVADMLLQYATFGELVYG